MRGLVELPAGEAVALEIVRQSPGWTFCNYLGDLRSGTPSTSTSDVSVAARDHDEQTYPGHDAEALEQGAPLVRGRGLLEETLRLVPTPQSLVSEGIASSRRPSARGRRRGGARRGHT